MTTLPITNFIRTSVINNEPDVIEEMHNIPGQVRSFNFAIAGAVVFSLLLIIGGGALIDEHSFQKDVKHNRDLKAQLLDTAAAKLQMDPKKLNEVIEKLVKDNPEQFVDGVFKDLERSTIDKVVGWWNSPSSREIKAKMNYRFSKLLETAIAKASADAKALAAAGPGPNPAILGGPEEAETSDATAQDTEDYATRVDKMKVSQQELDRREQDALTNLKNNPANTKGNFRRSS